MNGQIDIDICKGLGIRKIPFEEIYVPTNTNEKGEVEFTLRTTKTILSDFMTGLNEKKHYDKRHKELCYIIINNLFKKTNFLQLTIQLLEEQITEEEYEKEIKDNTNKYVIEINDYFTDQRDIGILFDIVKKISHTLTLDEVAEISSLNSYNIEKNIATK